MATITKQGKGYKIEVHMGYGAQGKRLRSYMTWVPEPGMTERQIEKALNKVATRFEDQVKNGLTVDSRIKFLDLSKLFLKDFGALHLDPKTFRSYTENLVRINAAIGHFRLCDLKPTHINQFYKNLQEAGVREAVTAICKKDLTAHLNEHDLSLSKFAAMAGLSRATVKAAAERKTISKESAEKIAIAMELPISDVFEVRRSMEPLAPSTVLAYHRTLNAILNKAVQWGYLESNPANRADKPKQTHKEAAYLDEDEARLLLKLLEDEPIKWRAIVTFDLLSGLRRQEILGLRWEDVDLDNRVIEIKQTSNYLPGRGVYEKGTKNASSRRPLRLSRVAILLLLEYKQWQDAQREKLGDAWEDQDGRVFTTEAGSPVFPDTVTQWFSKFVRGSELPKVTIHSLRHTYASLMIADGTPLVVVSQHLGHAQTSTTSNIYSHVISAAESRAQDAMDDKFMNLVAKKNPDTHKEKAAGE